MKRFWRDMGVLAALALVSPPVVAHEPHISVAGVSAGGTEGGRSSERLHSHHPNFPVQAGQARGEGRHTSDLDQPG